jgi:hypothetical protein
VTTTWTAYGNIRQASLKGLKSTLLRHSDCSKAVGQDLCSGHWFSPTDVEREIHASRKMFSRDEMRGY